MAGTGTASGTAAVLGSALTSAFVLGGAGGSTAIADGPTLVPMITRSGTTTGGGLIGATTNGGGGGIFTGGGGARNSGILIAPGGKLTVQPMYFPDNVRINTTNGC